MWYWLNVLTTEVDRMAQFFGVVITNKNFQPREMDLTPVSYWLEHVQAALPERKTIDRGVSEAIVESDSQ